MASLFTELGRRNVFRVGIAYVVASWLVLQVLDLVLENIGAPDWVMQTVMALLAIGFPVALMFAWAFEMTPEGLKREKDIDRSASITPQTGKKLDRLIIVFLVAVVVVMGVERSGLFGEQDSGETVVTDTRPLLAVDKQKSIAVLPFTDLSESQDQEWFGDGLSEEILNALMRTPDLLVASRTSSFKYKGSDKDIRDIGTDLGVAHVLEGSIRRAGDSIRVTAQLIRASDGFHVWSQNYDREMKDVISIQENLAIEIARALKTSMDPVALATMMQSGTHSVTAYERYLNGLSLEARANATGDLGLFRQSYEEMEVARQIDPGFAAAHARAAIFWDEQLRQVSRRYTGIETRTDTNMQNFLERIGLAIEHAPDPVTRMGYEAYEAAVRLELRKAVALLRQSATERPNDDATWDALLRAASFASDREMLEFALDGAQSLADVNPSIAALAPMIAYVLQRPDAGDIARRMLALHPTHREVVYQSHRALLSAGEVAEAAELLPLMTDDIWYSTARIRQACAEGNRALAEQIMQDSSGRTSGQWHAFMVLGNVEAANEVIRTTTSEAATYARANYLLYPQFDPSPFPDLVALLEREKIDRPPPIRPRYFCPPG